MHPHSLRILHELFDEDLAARCAFFRGMLQVIKNNNDFLDQLLFSDEEAVFYLSCKVNRHNCVYWSIDNLSHTTMKPLPPKTMVWMGVWSDALI